MEGNYPQVPGYFEDFYEMWQYKKTQHKGAKNIRRDAQNALQTQLRNKINRAIALYEVDYGDENPIIIDKITASPDYTVTLHFESGCLIEMSMFDYLSGALGGVTYELKGRNLIIPVKEPLVR